MDVMKKPKAENPLFGEGVESLKEETCAPLPASA